MSLVSENVLFELLEKGFVKTADVLVEHGMADVCTMHNGKSILWKVVRGGNEKMLKHLLQFCSAHHWKLQQGTGSTVAETDHGSCDVYAEGTEPQTGQPHVATTPATARNGHEEANLAVGCECALAPRLQLMNDLATEAARQNDSAMIMVLHEYNFRVDALSALFEAAEHSDGTVLKSLLRFGKVEGT